MDLGPQQVNNTYQFILNQSGNNITLGDGTPISWSSNNILMVTGDQVVSGNKYFHGAQTQVGGGGGFHSIISNDEFIYLVNGGISGVTIFSSEESSWFSEGLQSFNYGARTLHDQIGNTVLDYSPTGGAVFVKRPNVNGTGVVISSDKPVYQTGNQNISGNKTYFGTGDFRSGIISTGDAQVFIKGSSDSFNKPNLFGSGGRNYYASEGSENSFGSGAGYNYFGKEASENSFGDTSINYFGINSDLNQFGSNTISNAFGENSTSNEYGYASFSNQFGGNSLSNIFGSGSPDNKYCAGKLYDSSGSLVADFSPTSGISLSKKPSVNNTGVLISGDSSLRETWVFEGDSWTAGVSQGNDRQTYPYYISNIIGIKDQINIINVASGGDTATNMVNTFSGQVVPYLSSTTKKPSTAFIFAGINDVGLGRTTGQVCNDLRTLWSGARANGAKVVAFTLPHRSAAGGWSLSDWSGINNQIIADTGYYDCLIRTDIAFPNASSSSFTDGLHISSSSHALFANKILNGLRGETMTPVIKPNVICANGTNFNFSSNTRRNLPFNSPIDDGSDIIYSTINGDASTMVFVAPVDGTYEIKARSCIGGLTAGDQAQMSAWINRTGSETEVRLDYAYAAGANLTLGDINTRKLLRGDKVYASITTTRSGASWISGPAFFNVRYL